MSNVKSDWLIPGKPKKQRPKFAFVDYLSALVYIACAIFLIAVYKLMVADRVEQQPTEIMNTTCMATYVWYDRKIVQSWYNPIETLTDSLKQARKRQGEKIIELLD